MPHLILISASGTAQRRLLSKVLDDLASRGFSEPSVKSGGEWSDILTENSGGDLFEDKSATVIEEAEKLGELPERYAPMLEPPTSSSVIVLLARPRARAAAGDDDGGDESAAPQEASGSIIPKPLQRLCTMIKPPQAPPPWSKERDALVRSTAAEYDAAAEQSAIALLKDSFEDMSELESETRKLAAYVRGGGRKKITADDAAALCLDDGSRDLMQFLDAVCDGRAETAMRALSELERHFDTIPLLAALCNRLRPAMYMASYGDRADQLLQAIGTSDYAARQASSAVRNYSARAITDIMVSAFRISADERSGRGAGWRDIELMMIELFAGSKR